MKSFELAVKTAEILDSKKSEDTKIYNVSRFTIVAEYFVIATASSDTHRRALLDEVIKKLSVSGVRALRIEGRAADGGWTVADFGGVILHIMSEAVRREIGLEKLYLGARMRRVPLTGASKEKNAKNAQKRNKKKNIAATVG